MGRGGCRVHGRRRQHRNVIPRESVPTASAGGALVAVGLGFTDAIRLVLVGGDVDELVPDVRAPLLAGNLLTAG